MYGAGIQTICEQEILSSSGFHGNSEPGLWRKRAKWIKATRVRWPGISRLALVDTCAKVQNGGREKKVQVRSKFATTVTQSIAEAVKSGPRNVTGNEAGEVCPVPWSDTEGLVHQLPRKVSAGLILDNVGALYEGPDEDKYWSQNRCGLRHPYPVGYMATKTYKGVQFKQTIEKGPDGPIFVVGELNKAPCSADSPAKAWSMALANSQLDSAVRVHGRKHFGFDCPIVLGFLSQIEKGGPRISGVDAAVPKLHRHGIGDLEVHDERVSKISEDRPQFDTNERWSSAEQSRASRERVASAGPYERSIRLRSVLMEDIPRQRVQILSCQDNTHPVTKGFFQEAMSSLSNEDDSTIARTISTNEEFSPSRHTPSKASSSSHSGTILKQGVSALDTSLDSILRRMDEVAQNDGQGLRDDGSWEHENSERMANGRAPEQGVWRQNSSMGRFFTTPVSRARILSEESAPKETRRAGQARSLANLLEEWNKGGRSQSSRNGKPQNGKVGEGEGNSQLFRRQTKVERMPLTREEKDESILESTVQAEVPDSTEADIRSKVEQWHSGKDGRSSVVKEVQQLIDNSCVEKGLEILRTLHSNGAVLDDAVYSALFPFVFDDWQKQAVRHAQEKSVLVSAPGGAGKFAVATRCLYQAFVQGERCLIVTPYEAMAKDHWQRFQTLFGSKNVGCVISKEEDWRPDLPITVISLEAFVKGLREGSYSSGSSVGSSFSEGLSLAVMDRFHTLADANYGSLWEEAIMFLDHKVKVVALSLPIKTSNDITAWINSVHRPCEVVVCESEPVQKCHYFCHKAGLHLLEKKDEKLLSSKSQGSLSVEGDSVTDFQESIRLVLHSLQSEAYLPFAVSFSSIEDCIAATNIANEAIMEGLVSAEESACIEERIQHFFHENTNIESSVNKDDVKCLPRGFAIYHDGQLPLWTEFVQGLVSDNLVRIVFGTSTMLCSTKISFRTVALCLISGRSEAGKSSMAGSDFIQLCGKAGRRGHDSSGNVVFFGGNPTWLKGGAVMDSNSTDSHFRASYSLLSNLLSRQTLPEVRHFVESNYGEYLVKKQVHEELKELEVQISTVSAQKEALEAQLFQKLQKLNTTKLQDATIFTNVDVRVGASKPYGADDALPGVLCAVLPGPSKLLYVILGADNIFRLLPAGALDHVYTEEKPLDAVFKGLTGRALQAPSLPVKERWKLIPGDYLAYTSDGTTESARVVEVLLHHGGKFRKKEDEPNCREEIRSCNGLLSTLYEQQKAILLRLTDASGSPATTTWAKSEKLIEALVKADAVELASKDTALATIKPLGVLISKFHHVENELWFTMALSSSIVKPLTAPELASTCSALLYRSEETDSESPGDNPGSLNEANIAQDTPKRLRAALKKLENLRRSVEQLQGSDSPPLRLNGSAVVAVHSLCRELRGHDRADGVEYRMVLLVQRIIKLLHEIDDVWGRSLDVLSALEGTPGLHNLARRAAHLMEKVLLFMQTRS